MLLNSALSCKEKCALNRNNELKNIFIFFIELDKKRKYGIISLLFNIKLSLENNEKCYLEDVMIRIKLCEVLGREKMTRKKLAELTSVRPNTIGDLYNENVKKIDLDLLSRICQTLHCDVSDLLEYKEEEEN